MKQPKLFLFLLAFFIYLHEFPISCMQQGDVSSQNVENTANSGSTQSKKRRKRKKKKNKKTSNTAQSNQIQEKSIDNAHQILNKLEQAIKDKSELPNMHGKQIETFTGEITGTEPYDKKIYILLNLLQLKQDIILYFQQIAKLSSNLVEIIKNNPELDYINRFIALSTEKLKNDDGTEKLVKQNRDEYILKTSEGKAACFQICSLLSNKISGGLFNTNAEDLLNFKLNKKTIKRFLRSENKEVQFIGKWFKALTWKIKIFGYFEKLINYFKHFYRTQGPNSKIVIDNKAIYGNEFIENLYKLLVKRLSSDIEFFYYFVSIKIMREGLQDSMKLFLTEQYNMTELVNKYIPEIFPLLELFSYLVITSKIRPAESEKLNNILNIDCSRIQRNLTSVIPNNIYHLISELTSSIYLLAKFTEDKDNIAYKCLHEILENSFYRNLAFQNAGINPIKLKRDIKQLKKTIHFGCIFTRLEKENLPLPEERIHRKTLIIKNKTIDEIRLQNTETESIKKKPNKRKRNRTRHKNNPKQIKTVKPENEKPNIEKITNKMQDLAINKAKTQLLKNKPERIENKFQGEENEEVATCQVEQEELELPRLIYDTRIYRWFDSTFAQHHNTSSVLYHTFCPAADPLIVKYGIEKHEPNKTNKNLEDKKFHLGGEICWPDGKKKTVLFCVCMDHNGVIYHRGFEDSLKNDELFSNFEQSEYEHNFPQLRQGTEELELRKNLFYEFGELQNTQYYSTDFYFYIKDTKNNVKLVLFKPASAYNEQI